MMSKKRLVVILGNLTAFGPFVTDFYLPCLPRLTRDFGVTASLVQLSLTAGLAGLALGQVLVGPVSDKYGRKRPLVWSLLLFALATVGCMLSWGIAPLICFRLLQGLTGASSLVISRAMVSDMFTGDEEARYFALFSALLGVAPIVAPLVGGAAFSLSSWQGTFAVLAVWSLWLLYECSRLRETLGERERMREPLGRAFLGYKEVLRNRPCMVMILTFSCANAALMSYVSASPFIFQQHFGLTPMQYSLLFASNAVALILGSAVVMKVKNLRRDEAWGCWGLLAGCVLSALALFLGLPFAVFEAAVVVLLFCIGILTPVAVTLAMNSAPEHRGMASALVGAIPYIVSGVAAPLTGLGDVPRSTSLLLLICSAGCTVFYLVSRRWRYA
ncbi:MAG: multidrug effflux MFS transporter [Prevotellaceae bacterium]|nr:multidrug effflux MFS transporter [Prevotellaceae bacterium]